MSPECQPPQTKLLAADYDDEEEDDSPVEFLDHAQSQGIIFNNLFVDNVILTLSFNFKVASCTACWRSCVIFQSKPTKRTTA